jgi:hypothetical protein
MGGAEKRMGPPEPSSSQYGSRHSMFRTYGPRDIISLVIPRIGDNRVHTSFVAFSHVWHIFSWSDGVGLASSCNWYIFLLERLLYWG